ncbi:hypothetical protein [Aliivibrio wodanis]|uniref:hypothetical protein n=1 Tax=Aliivibrio wodanis TaxID=80852 RepID=UPI00406D4CEB
MFNTSTSNVDKSKATTMFCVLASTVIAFSTAVSAQEFDTQSQYSKETYVISRSGSPITFVDYNENEASEASAVSAQSMITKVTDSFGLAIKDYETIFGVKRATIYNWKKGIQPAIDAQFKKLQELYGMSDDIAEVLNNKVGRLSKTHHYHDSTIIQKLSQTKIDHTEILAHYELLNTIVMNQKSVHKKYGSNVITEDTVILSGELG